MKKTIYISAAAYLALLSSCNLDLYPVTSYNEGNVSVDEESETQYSTRADMLGLRDAIYNSYVKNIQESGYQDWLVYSECRADNAYCGSPSTGEIAAIESNNVDGENKNVVRDWSYFMEQVSNANQIICNIDSILVNDSSMTQTEHDEWKSEALCWRAYNLFFMTQLWGDVPMVTTIPPAITAENIEEVYDEYFPSRTPIGEVYDQIIEDLEYACQYAPEPNVADEGDKNQFSKGFAYGLLARVYAEKTRQDWQKVAEYCQAVEDFGYRLCENYGDLWAYDDSDVNRNTTESIFEVTWTKDQGNWVWMMFHRNYYNPDDSFTWAKWITPSRDLIAAYEAEGDTERMNASIVWDQCSWSNYYPSDNYAFMHKCPTNASSIILMRLGEIYLLHAEALAMLGNFSAGNGATYYVNLVRERAKLDPIDELSSQEDMIDAVLHERRLELAFEGFRFFDLVRHDKAKEVHDSMPLEDSYWQTRYALTDETILMPVPTTEMDNNPSLVQNPGY
ncbi:MAG: RagB/SusD family nutrient uptake outer membrane protein [Bacteroidetes bacterium]|uniref:RagB/SusD family nutrient uptake outer membrane protein n=1 Tax=Candidatus Cryptobacteroides excrementipullorum TaxID=2840761 RepID=A0A9D9IT46_9BACT|nr:RagB/SusD family nutrient uptake outer membrane protein [Candidatus Cryptobacteroides excrementipullorum]